MNHAPRVVPVYVQCCSPPESGAEGEGRRREEREPVFLNLTEKVLAQVLYGWEERWLLA